MTITQEPAAGQHVRCAGEDVRAGDTVLTAGTRLNAPALGLAAALGLDELTVHPRLRVVIASTGSELMSSNSWPYSKNSARRPIW
ncbi:molybdopterin molybdenumtransferase 2 [Mycobacteroides abscessus subsp. massiliense]|nr:molybdopterin molybdenumtransferase 2 [Mycobacteroides abscessus subsp. massiliense]